MSREIKFRAWDGEDMLTNLDSVNLEAVRCDAIDSPDGESVICCTYMQYTEKNDMYDDNIYDGDLITISYGIPATTNLLEVYWCCGQWMTKRMDKGLPQLECPLFDLHSGDLLVKGNIYANKDLLP